MYVDPLENNLKKMAKLSPFFTFASKRRRNEAETVKHRVPLVSEEREKNLIFVTCGGACDVVVSYGNDRATISQFYRVSLKRSSDIGKGLFCFGSMALPSCLKTRVPMSPTTGFNLSGSLMKLDSGFAVPTKLQSIRKGDRESLRIQAVFSFPPLFLTKNGRAEKQKQLKQELLEAIEPLERGAKASPDDQLRIDQLARKVEAVNPTKEPLKSDLINGKWELIYTTSASILQAKKPRFLRSITNYQSINVDTLKVQNMETWPFYNSVTGDLKPLNSKKVAVKLQVFKILGFIPIKAPDTARGELEITYVDEELRLSRGDKGNLFILKMFDPTYRIPL